LTQTTGRQYSEQLRTPTRLCNHFAAVAGSYGIAGAGGPDEEMFPPVKMIPHEELPARRRAAAGGPSARCVIINPGPKRTVGIRPPCLCSRLPAGMSGVEPLIAQAAPSRLRDFPSRPALKHRHVDAHPSPLGPTEAPSAARLHRPVPARPRPQGAGGRRLAARAQARRLAASHKDGDEVRLWSRNGRNWSAEMVAIAAAIMARRSPGSS
jgi:hypothetical protein